MNCGALQCNTVSIKRAKCVLRLILVKGGHCVCSPLSYHLDLNHPGHVESTFKLTVNYVITYMYNVQRYMTVAILCWNRG